MHPRQLEGRWQSSTVICLSLLYYVHPMQLEVSGSQLFYRPVSTMRTQGNWKSTVVILVFVGFVASDVLTTICHLAIVRLCTFSDLVLFCCWPVVSCLLCCSILVVVVVAVRNSFCTNEDAIPHCPRLQTETCEELEVVLLEIHWREDSAAQPLVKRDGVRFSGRISCAD